MCGTRCNTCDCGDMCTCLSSWDMFIFRYVFFLSKSLFWFKSHSCHQRASMQDERLIVCTKEEKFTPNGAVPNRGKWVDPRTSDFDCSPALPPCLPPSIWSLDLFSVHRCHPHPRFATFRSTLPVLPFFFPSLPPFLPFPSLPLPWLVVCIVTRRSRDRSRTGPGPFRFSKKILFFVKKKMFLNCHF